MEHGAWSMEIRREKLNWNHEAHEEHEDKDRIARMFHELLAATLDIAVLPGVLGCRTLRRTVQVRLGTNPLWLPGGTPIVMVSRHQFMKHPG
jgi:hypothetical protein